jgi:hypothetical protein
MGLDARVSCRCLQDGLAAPPPVPVRIDDAGVVTAVEDTDQSWIAVSRWRSTACPHRDFQLVRRSIGAWRSVADLEAVLRDQGGPSSYPVLLSRFPTHDGRCVSPGESIVCLDELDRLERAFHPATRLVLVADRSVVVREELPTPGGWYYADGRALRYRLSGSGLEVLDGAGRHLFAALRLRQDPVEQGYLLTDLDTGASLVVPRRIDEPSNPAPAPSTGFEVHQHRREYSDVAAMVGSLRTVFRAAAESGNPVWWC